MREEAVEQRGEGQGRTEKEERSVKAGAESELSKNISCFFKIRAAAEAHSAPYAPSGTLIPLLTLGSFISQHLTSFDGSEVFAPSYCAHAPPSSDAPPLSASSMV